MKITERPGRLPVLETPRLFLRDIAVVDISDDYVAWLNDPATTRYLEIRFVEQTRERVVQYVQDKMIDVDSSKHFGVYDEGGERLVGTVTLPVINWHHRFADLSFVIGHSDAQGRGYATEAVAAVVYYAFRVCRLEKLYAGYYEGHAASATVLARNGFSEEGRLRKKLVNVDGDRVDQVLLGLLAEDYTPRNDLLGEL